MPKVSVVIPIFTRSHYLGEAIQSVLDQTFQDFEIIVVDNGLMDNMRQIVDNFNDSRLRYVYRENTGASAAQNIGFKIAHGDYITGLSKDDLYLPQNLETKVKLLDSHPDIAAVCSDAYIFNHHTGAIISRLWHDPKGPKPGFDPARAARQPVKEILTKGYFIMVQTAMLRRQVFDEVGYLYEALPNHEDWEMFLRVVQRFSIETIDTPLVKIRRNRSNLFHKEKLHQGTAAATREVIRSGLLSREEIKLLKNKMLPQYLSYGREALLGGREAAARKAFLAGIQLDPWKIKIYVYLVFSILGTSKLLALKSWRRNLRRRSVGRQSSGGTLSSGG